MASIEYKVDRLSMRNYNTWKTVIKSHLMSKDLWDYIVESKNATDEEKIQNEKAKHLIYVSMEPSVIAATGVCDSAYDLWTKIKENYEGSETNLQSTSLAEFLGLKYINNESLISYCSRYELALGKLKSAAYNPDEKTKLWVFSNSLPPHLKMTVNMFTMAKPEGTVNQLITQLKIQHHNETHDAKTDASASAFQVKHERNQTQQNSYCKYNNSNEYRATNHGQNTHKVSCTYCKKLGHIWKECRKLKADNDRKRNYSTKAKIMNKTEEQRAAFTAKLHEFSGDKHTWIIDSGASNHMSPYKEIMVNYNRFKTPRKIKLGNGSHLLAIGMGNIPFESDKFLGELQDVLHVPKITENLFSVCKTMKLGCVVEFKELVVNFYRDRRLVLRGHKRENSLYFLLQMKPSASEEQNSRCYNASCALVGASLQEWHKRLAHCSPETIKIMAKNKVVDGLKILNNKKVECQPCIMGKMTRASHPERRRIKADKNSAVLHFDTVCPMKEPSLGGSRYFVLATEELSGFKYVETISLKSQIPPRIKLIINKAELESGRKIKSITTDNGTEFTNKELDSWLMNNGIWHNYSVAHTPQQNGRAERANRTILDGVRTLLFESKLPPELWAEAANTVVYTLNRVPSSRRPDKTRYELFCGQKPNINNLHIFGQKAIMREPDTAREGKLAARGKVVTFVGYTERFNTYRFYTEIPVQQIIESCDVRFIENPKNTESQPSVRLIESIETSSDSSETEVESQTDSNNDQDSSGDDNSDDEIIEYQRPATRSFIKAMTSGEESINGKQAPCNEAALFTLDDEPRTVEDAQARNDWSRWKEAMDLEMKALKNNQTWTLVERPHNVRPIKNKWVFKIKLKPDGEVDRYKARLVAKGYTQIPNIDYKETFAPTAQMSTIRMILAIANQLSMHLIQFDVKTAFLYGELDEDLYMEQPTGYKEGNLVCKLTKSIYGLKQAPRNWNRKFDNFLKLFNLNQSIIDKCLYYNDERTLLLAIYVDDGLAAGCNKKQLDNLMAYLNENFDLKTMAAESYLGFQINRNLEEGTLYIYQTSYIDKLLNKFSMTDCNIAPTPEQVGANFENSPQLPTDNKFKELVGSILYIAVCTRPDISHAISSVSRTAEPTEAHWTALKRILRYLKGTKELGICFKQTETNQLTAYSDADYANDTSSRKSTTGYCILLNGSPIVWRCQKQSIVTLSTTEAEYVAGCDLVKDLIPVRELLIELKQISQNEPTTIYIDNQSAIKIASNERNQSRTKHIDIRQKWLSEQVQKKTIDVKHISGNEQAADILTKPLHKPKFTYNRSKLLTQILAALSLMLVMVSQGEMKQLKLTDYITTIPSEYTYIAGDTRYILTSVFANPCESFFNFSTVIDQSETLLKFCFEHYERKILNTLPNCRQLPTIGPNLTVEVKPRDCGESYQFDLDNPVQPLPLSTGRCDITRRQTKAQPPIPNSEVIDSAWINHKKAIESLKPLRRNKRIIPLMLLGGSVFLSLYSTGKSFTAHRIGQYNSDNIDTLIEQTNIHSEILKNATVFFDQVRDTVTAINHWASDVEERLGNDANNLRLYKDPILKGKKANLVLTYMTWFDNQEKLLGDINWAAANRKVPSSLKTMINLTKNHDLATNWSVLHDCSYRLENKSMILNLDFTLPSIGSEMQILRVAPMDHYNHTEDANGESSICWTRYVGPSHVLMNNTNGCITKLHEEKIIQRAIRAQTCNGQMNDLNSSDLLWKSENCTSHITPLEDKVQIHEIDGIHKIYCYPFQIELQGQNIDCPNSTFVIDGHSNYKIGNIVHKGGLVNTTTVRRTRRKRSPIGDIKTTSVATSTVGTSTVATTTNITPDKPKIANTLTNITTKMNETITNLKESIKKLPTLNITKADIDTIFTQPLNLIESGLNSIGELFKSLGTSIGLISACLMFIVLMPLLEIIFIGARVLKVPVNIWIGSARRVKLRLKEILPGLSRISKKRKRWDG